MVKDSRSVDQFFVLTNSELLNRYAYQQVQVHNLPVQSNLLQKGNQTVSVWLRNILEQDFKWRHTSVLELTNIKGLVFHIVAVYLKSITFDPKIYINSR